MKRFYAYIRVSSLKQGEKGVSLQEQRAAIDMYAKKHNLQICEWFEERLTAAKKGRPGFMKMMKGLRAGRADGVIIHKIDRSTRNLRDWADLGDLIDAGVSVHFANESLDLLSRGGRLAADIQAVVASDYIRNLREEAKKGLWGRLKQGIFPFSAPLGYLNSGSGKVKAIDPARSHFVRQAFELYSTGRYTLDTLVAELHRRGLRNSRGRVVPRNCLSLILNNSFYAGLIRLRTTGETFLGGHTPLITMSLFKQVNARLHGRIRVHGWTHDFMLRGLFHCSLCGRFLTPEKQKGHVYYRCHTKACPTRTIREEVLEAAILQSWAPLAVSEDSKRRLLGQLEHVLDLDSHSETERRVQIETQIGAIKSRHTRLVDAFLDGALDKESFEGRKRALLEEERSLQDSLRLDDSHSGRTKQHIMELFELASNAQQSYRLASPASKRELVIRLCSNRSVAGKQALVEPYFPSHLLELGNAVHQCGHHRNAVRTERRIAEELVKWAKQEVKRLDDAA